MKRKMEIDREKIKELAKGRENCTTEDLTALTTGNDPFYIRPNHIEKAKWFAKVWKKEGKPKIHPRGLHYRILGKGYEVKIGNKEETYQNTHRCWNYLKKGCKYARLLGLVPYDKIKDEKNPEPKKIPKVEYENEFRPVSVEAIDLSDYCDLGVDSYLEQENVDELIDSLVFDITWEVMRDVEYDSFKRQPNYLEIWAEKKGVVPKEIRRFNITIREAGGGEMSLDMCHKAVKRAKKLDKDLHIFLLVDFDPKGRDMPKSVARKVEKLARERDVKAYVHHTALTKKQCKEYALPTTPAKKPKGGGTGSKAYKKHTEIFKKFAGQDPTELNSFQSREPKAYRKTIREAITPYFDEGLDKKLKEGKERVKKEVKEKVRRHLEDKKKEIEAIRGNIQPKIEELKGIIKNKKEEIGLHEKVKKLAKLLYLDREEIEDIEFEEPKIDVSEPKKPLLDSTRGYLEQIKEYKEFDVRED